MIYMVNVKDIFLYLLLSLCIILLGIILVYLMHLFYHKHKEKHNFIKNTDFFSCLAHDLKSPLTTINGYAYMSKQCLGDSNKLAMYLEKIENSSKYMQALINDTLGMTKLIEHQDEIVLNQVNLSDLIEQCLDNVEIQMNSKKIQFIKNINIKHCLVMVDGLHLIQIVTNLLTNSIKYTKEFGEVSFSVYEKELSINLSSYEIIVKDNGCGMSEEFKKKIFKPFSQEHRVDTNIPSSGLGLYIVKKYVDMMHGDIIVESKENIGSCFTIKLELHHLNNE